jgi:hypothetical protein
VRAEIDGAQVRFRADGCASENFSAGDQEHHGDFIAGKWAMLNDLSVVALEVLPGERWGRSDMAAFPY